jgi:hypothetical protein
MPSTLQSPPAFPDHARAVVRSLRGAFSELLTSVGVNPQDPQAITSALGLNKNLAWKISKIVQTDDPAQVLKQMPGASGIRIFLKSLEETGASAAALEAARHATDEFDDLIRVHSGDRATLEMMGSELSPAGRPNHDEYHRKLLFQGASYVWGVQARVVLKVGVIAPGATPGTLDFASLSALIDFRRLRSDATWVMAARRSTNDDGTEMSPPPSEPIDTRYAAGDQAPLMADFCSQPVPELRGFKDQVGTSFELVEGRVGNTGMLTCTVGTIQRQIPYYRTPTNEWGEHSALCETPAEVLILDLFFHQQLTFAIPPEPALYSELRASVPYPGRGRERNRLPLSDSLQDLGTGPLLLATPEVRHYRQMVQAIFDRTGWSPTQFHGFRMKIAYPVSPSVLVLRYRLPAPPK